MLSCRRQLSCVNKYCACVCVCARAPAHMCAHTVCIKNLLVSTELARVVSPNLVALEVDCIQNQTCLSKAMPFSGLQFDDPLHMKRTY